MTKRTSPPTSTIVIIIPANFAILLNMVVYYHCEFIRQAHYRGETSIVEYENLTGDSRHYMHREDIRIFCIPALLKIWCVYRYHDYTHGNTHLRESLFFSYLSL